MVALLPENSQKLSDAITDLLTQSEPTKDNAPLVAFDTILKRWRNVTELLRAIPDGLDVGQKPELAQAVCEMCEAAASGFGMVIVG